MSTWKWKRPKLWQQSYVPVCVIYYQCDLLHRLITECVVVCEWYHLSDLDPHGHPTSVKKDKVEKNHSQVIANARPYSPATTYLSDLDHLGRISGS